MCIGLRLVDLNSYLDIAKKMIVVYFLGSYL